MYHFKYKKQKYLFNSMRLGVVKKTCFESCGFRKYQLDMEFKVLLGFDHKNSLKNTTKTVKRVNGIIMLQH